MKVKDFGGLDDAMLFISWDDIFLRFGGLETLRLVLRKGEKWVEKCRRRFVEGARGGWSRGVGKKLLEIEVMEVEKK